MTNDDAKKDERRRKDADRKRAKFLADPEKVRERQRAWRKANRERLLANRRELYAADPSRQIEASRRYRAENAEKLAEKRRTDEHRKRAREAAARRRSSPAVAINASIRSRIHKDLAARGLAKSSRTQRLLGYSTNDLMDHLEKQFTQGMTWSNFGEWHIDHIIPLSKFNITSADSDEFRAAWSLGNLRPLWAKDNNRKYNKTTHLL